jgi:spore coat polysaccharide biosynthesis protein SpsF (cytidylyltransferase family)/aryl-alcohol dehydrogenase-like predicted oxidoreductase
MALVIIQARTNSSRLPGKVLLPIAGLPLVVLAARRAANAGANVIVATSNEPTDDVLANVLADAGIRCFRGSLENTLDRMVGALTGYDDDTLVFRLTADNVFPDGTLLKEMEEDFLAKGISYLCCNGEQSGLPYGMSAELTRAGHLREANHNVTSQHDREHVTPYIRRAHGTTYFQRYKSLNKGLYRCTVDSLDDYLSVQNVFAGVPDPEKVSAFDLVERLVKAPLQPTQSKPASMLVLGTAQLGMTYGIANQTGMPSQQLADDLIKTAIVNGVHSLDTASAYGRSEEVIGRALKSGWQERVNVITKLGLLADCPNEATEAIVKIFVDESIFRSCTSLQSQTIDVLMLHRMEHRKAWSGAVWSQLLDHKFAGRIKALGVSVQNPDELVTALEEAEIEFIQMPFNVLDWRWDKLIEKIRTVKARRTLKIHVRSGLLQGLLVSAEPDHWRRANVDSPELIQNWLKQMTADTDSQSVAAFCLNYAKSLDWVDGVVVGMETKAQLLENIHIFTNDDFTQEQLERVNELRPKVASPTLNPSQWRN